MASDRAYLDALKLLARRELSEAQVRQRLARRGHDGDAAEAAIARLKRERAIDDDRVAEAIARAEVSGKLRGRIRVRQKISQAGIAPVTAHRAIEAAFDAIDDEALINAALARRLPAGAWIESDAEFQRLGRYLTGQGFDSDQIVQTLTPRRRRR